MYSKLIYYTLVNLLALYFFLLAATSQVLAEEYVLPYPSFMPGHPLYKIQTMIDKVQEFYSFGNFAKFKYHLEMADKKLVETKTLFEYKQYLLAASALEKSDEHFSKTSVFLAKARKEGKDLREKRHLLILAAKKHKEVLEKTQLVVPPEFNWQPEKREATLIRIKSLIEDSIKIRQQAEAVSFLQ